MRRLTQVAREQLDLFKGQYLQLQTQITYPDREYLGKEIFQQALYNEIFDSKRMPYQPHERYRLRILKELMARIESSIDDWEEEGICEDLMILLASLLSGPVPTEADAAQLKQYVTYAFSTLIPVSTSEDCSTASVTLLESSNLLAAGGTTGLRTWEGGLHLASFLSSASCPVRVKDKCVLELGAGTGLLSILCAKYLGASYITATDGSATVVKDMATNLLLNNLNDGIHITREILWWGHDLAKIGKLSQDGGRKIDLVLGADITYDSSAMTALVETLHDLVSLNSGVEVIISATIRNEETFRSFVNNCALHGFSIVDLQWPIPNSQAQIGPFYSNAVPIRICRVVKK